LKIGTKMGSEGLKQKRTNIASEETNELAIDG
jgi:hypothetical protein